MRTTPLALFLRPLDDLRTLLSTDADRIACAAVFGSAARAEDAPGSDFDVLVITHSRTDVDPIHARLAEAIPSFADQFGLDLSPVVIPLERFRTMHRDGDPLPAAVTRDARIIPGSRPEGLLHG